MDAKTREQLRAQYPNERLRTIVSEDDGIEIVVKGAPPAIWAKYKGLKGDFADAGKRSQADELLVRGSMVYPEQEAFHAGLVERSLLGFYSSAASLVAQHSGARENLRVGEL